MSFVDDDEAEIAHGCKEGRTGANDNLRRIRLKGFLPKMVANGFGLGGM